MSEEDNCHLINILKNNKSKDGTSLYTIINQTFNKILNENEEYTQTLDFYEQLQDFIKQNNFVYSKRPIDISLNENDKKPSKIFKWIQYCEKLIKNQNIHQQILFPDFYNENAMLEIAGINFSEEESQIIQMSIRRLADQKQASQIRFWGKILCQQQDYYIAEGITANENADTLPKDCEKKGEGANMYTFWVTNNPLKQWVELPLVTPQQIQQVRQIKYVFTGNLNNEIKNFPPFQGQEAHFLKAQIVRISSSCILVPKGVYEVNSETNKIQFPEELFKYPEYTSLKDLSQWCHLHSFLNTQGRTTYYIDPDFDEEQKLKAEEESGKEENNADKLKEIAEEKKNEETQSNWYMREYGDLQQFTSEDQTSNYGVTVLRNKTWQGHYTVFNNERWCNIYIGYGLKTNQNPFVPTQPDDLCAEVEDTDEFSEPNHKDPPPKEDAPQDDENKEYQDQDQNQDQDQE
ncbi:radial spoke head protein, putative [Ichthyophthirius multifiliis]|uniref:Radial spoke head protein, putative n=1 Tax=Ichthyophthirius multifiliis TaxID=5932 RepID=G0QIS6_ICHMU|nr:radial spoke head protein, putative [Ichthyophthirius multifiliis]EGR34905.1 radial spoke head protein, putative [Ichthyophthirius multifiliis]|eukprot:XP_004040209.1 radial spoke head protein, putative [Ichthyophthirius multifiliis]